MPPRTAPHNPRRGRRPLAFQAHPRDISRQKMPTHAQHFLSPNIPAGGSHTPHPHRGPEQSAQNPFFKDFDGRGARA
jgi:hypothetical protein